MTRDDIIRMAREAGIPETATEGVFIANSDDLGRLIAAEREACAKVCESLNEDFDHLYVSACADVIRARGQG
jgi:predicted ThiF/HesA family dinucleotide-utilizing enzyme